MSAGAIAGIIIALILVAVVVGVAASISMRRQRLRKRFGPEYDRVLSESDSRRVAETELSEREKRVQGLELTDLSEATREQFETRWADVQELFVESPVEAIAQGQRLVEEVMRERGYPVAEFDQTIADLSVEHARTLDHFRSAHEVSQKAAADQATTEDTRTALLQYRELFGELLGVPAPALALTGGRDGNAEIPGSGPAVQAEPDELEDR